MENDDAHLYFEKCCELLSYFQNVDESGIYETSQTLAKLSSKYNLPYIILYNFLERFQNSILCDTLKEGNSSSPSLSFFKADHYLIQ